MVPNTNVLKSYIHTYGPVYTAMYAGYYDAWADEFYAYDGSYTLYYAGTEQPNHAVLIVGWDDNLIHTGGTGGWIVKNSWGTGRGGTCGYGSERGYFTIAYGSASIGSNSSFIYDWQDYDASGGLMYYDEAGGWWDARGYGSTTAWGLCRFFPASNTSVTRVEFWTCDATSDVDVYLYDDFDVQTETVSNLQRTIANLSYNEAGYHSVEVNPPLPATAGDDVIVTVKFTNSSYTYPIAVDSRGPAESQRTYMSSSGLNGSWYDLGTAENVDVAIRLRTSGVGATATPTRTSSPTPTDTLTPTPTDALTPTATPTHTLTPTPRGYGVFLPIMLRGYPMPTPSPHYVQLIRNHSFETNEAWEILRTAYWADYSVSRAHSGSRSMRLGIDTSYNVYSYSSVQQTVDIPSGVTQAELSFYYFPVSAQVDGDRIYFCVLRASDDYLLERTFWTDHNQAWNLRTFNLLSYAGQRVNLRFGVKNDGLDGITTVYLDDVELWVLSSE